MKVALRLDGNGRLKGLPRLVILESRFSAIKRFTDEQNLAYARACLLDSLARGEAPIMANLLYDPAFWLDETLRADSFLAAATATAWRRAADFTVFYEDHGTSSAMRKARHWIYEKGFKSRSRYLGPPWSKHARSVN